MTDVKFVLASFDHKKDTPENLNDYMTKRKLSKDLWTFLSPSNEAAARELSVVLGISFKNIGDGDFSHSNVITLLDEEGVPVPGATIDSLSADSNVFTEALAKKAEK